MPIDKVASRWLIVLIIAAALAWVEATLWGRHYYHLTWAACRESAYTIPDCTGWKITAWFQAIVVVTLGSAALIWNERRVR